MVKQSAIVLAAFLGVCAFSGPAMAGQNLTSDATIIGRVVDESKAVLPGVTVTATSPALQAPSVSDVTNENGEYRLTPLPIGTYTVEYTLPGFQTVRREEVRLTGGFTARLDITMGVGQLAETITVSGATPQVDVASTTATTQITKEALDTIPMGGAGFVGLVQMIPGVRAAIDVGGNTLNSNPSLVELGSVSQTWQTVEGVATKNPRSTESGNYFDFSGAEEAVASTLGHDSSVPNRGLNLNVIMASGGNQFHGKAFYGGTSDKFQSEQEAGGGENVEIRDDVHGEIGGRIVRDKLWFWTSMRHQRSHSEVDCTKPDGSPCEDLQDTTFLTFKVTGQLGAKDKLVGFFMRNRGFAEETSNNLRPWESRRPQVLTPQVGKIEWQRLMTNNLVLTANWGGWEGYSGTICPDGPHSLDPFPSTEDLSSCKGVFVRDSVLGSVKGYNERGGERLLESRYQARVSASYYKPDWFHGNHEFKTGFDYFKAPQNRHQSGRGPANEYTLVVANGVASQVIFLNNPVHPDLTINYYDGYVADSWTIGRKLTLNLGLRYGYDAGTEHEGCREAALGDSGVIFPAKCYGDTHMTVYNTLAGRARAAYDIRGDGRSVVKGGWGRFYQMRSADQLQIISNNVISSATYRWRDLNTNGDYNTGETNLDPNGPDFVTITGVPGYAGIQGGYNNPNEKDPFTDEYSLQFEQQLTTTLALRATYVYRAVKDMLRLGSETRPYSAYNIPIDVRDPGKDNVLNTADDTGNTIRYYDFGPEYAGRDKATGLLVNDSKANESYNTIEWALTKRMSKNFMFSIANTDTKKHWPLIPDAGTINSQNPNAEIFAADDTWEWLTRASGSYSFPHGILFSANFESRSGNTTARTIRTGSAPRVGALTLRVEPVGTVRLPTLNLLTFRAEKSFAFAHGQRFLVRTNIFNTLNVDSATGMTVSSGANYGLITGRVLPRIMNFEFQYTF